MPNNTTNKPKPCPFCQHTVVTPEIFDGPSCRIRCFHCCARGPLGGSVEQAILLWNYRGLRDPLEKFAFFMELILTENDHKGGWQDMGAAEILIRLREEMQELHEAASMYDASFDKLSIDKSRKLMTREAADVANFAMILSDNFGIYETE